MSDRSASPIQTELPTEKVATPTDVNPKKRPRLDLEAEPRKKGKRSVFGQVFGTLRKAKDADEQRNASDAAKKRQEIDNRILTKITKDQIEVRRVEEAKRDRTAASRKEEDLAIKDGIVRLRQATIPRLANFLLTTDSIPRSLASSRSPSPSPINPSPTSCGHPPKTQHPGALYYLPSRLTAQQKSFLEKQKALVRAVLGEERKEWIADRSKGVEEVSALRTKAGEPTGETKVVGVLPGTMAQLDADMENELSPRSPRVSDSGLTIAPEMPLLEGSSTASNPTAMDTAEDAIEY